MQKMQFTGDQALCMVEDVIVSFEDAEIILMVIVLNDHYHLLIMDRVKRKYILYWSLQSRTYDTDARAMVRTRGKFVRLITSLDMW